MNTHIRYYKLYENWVKLIGVFIFVDFCVILMFSLVANPSCHLLVRQKMPSLGCNSILYVYICPKIAVKISVHVLVSILFTHIAYVM